MRSSCCSPSPSSRSEQSLQALDWTDLDAPLISAFLDHLETDRENSPRTRNARLTAIRSRFNYAALRHPEHAAIIQRVLAIPPKRFDKPTVSFLTPSEIDALIAAPEQRMWEGRRDRTLLLVDVQTGLRVSELIGLNCGDATLGTGAHLRCEGKGRKQRAVPLTSWQRVRGKRLRLGLLNIPARVVRTARRLHLRLPAAYQHAAVFIAALERIRALPAFT